MQKFVKLFNLNTVNKYDEKSKSDAFALFIFLFTVLKQRIASDCVGNTRTHIVK